MIPRYQKVILWLLLVSSVLMAAYLIRMRARAEDQLAAVSDTTPMPIPVETKPSEITLMIANDEDGSLAPMQKQIALPIETTTRAKVLLNDLFADYAQPDSSHPLAAVSAIDDVFLLPMPSSPDAATNPGQIAVVNFNGAFVDHHPSGILVETLTLLSILGTLHANLPQIVQVRFLVDGQPKDTLAGHADLTHIYLASGDVPVTANTPATSDNSAAQQPGGTHDSVR